MSDKEQTILLETFKRSRSPMVLTDLQGVITLCNHSFCLMTGYSEKQLLAQKISLLKSDEQDASFYRNLWNSLTHFGSWEGELLNRKANGALFPCWVKIERLENDPEETQYLANYEDLTMEKRVEQSLYRASNYDVLTRLPNRNLFMDLLRNATFNAKKKKRPFSVVCFDLDHFKTLNSSLGVRVGDDILLSIGDRLLRNYESNHDDQPLVARTGGDEFTLLFTESMNQYDLVNQIHHLQKIISEPFNVRGHRIDLTCTCGIALFPDHGLTPELLLRNAQHALDIARRGEPNSYTFFEDGMSMHSREQLRILNALRQSDLKTHGFELYLQPKIYTHDGSLAGAEALLRWHDPEYGLVTPDKFLTVLENSELIHQVGLWVVAEACRFIKNLLNEGFDDFHIAVNISPRQFTRDNLVSSLISILEEHQIHGHFLELELTETTLARTPLAISQALDTLQDLGVSIAIDDFGTGYSSLASLASFKLNTLKIDRAFVQALGTDEHGTDIAQAIIAIGKALKLKLVAEGVENSEQFEFMQHQQCHMIQGFYFARPMPFNQFIEYCHSLPRRPSQ